MGIFDRIRNAIFGRGGQRSAATGGSPTERTAGHGAGTVNRGTAAATGTSAPAAPTRTAAAAPAVDVEQVLESLAAENGRKLNWRSSIVDLMKLLDLDSSLENRKELARELGYVGSTDDSATMNVWLHRQVMRRLAENGGIVPADLRD